MNAVEVRRSKRLGRFPEWVQREIDQSSDPFADAEAVQIARRIMKDYGGDRGLKRLIKLFEGNRNGSDIAEKYEVTKQRVSQWRSALGFVQEKFVLRDVVQKALTKGLA